MKIDFAYISDRGLNPRYTVNEDSYLIMPDEHVFAVADGVGGAHAGDVASSSALGIIKKGVEQFGHRSGDNKIRFLQILIKAANNVVYQKGKRKNKQMASTLAIVLIDQNYAVIGHVGDSRIYIIRDGKLVQLTKDHSKLQELLDQNPQLTITRNNYSDGHVITRALGADPIVYPDIQKVILKHNDIFILCTDGIYSHNSDVDLLDAINQYANMLPIACEQFKLNCYEKGAKDNLTAIVLKISQE
ncbi:serine/threonine-protein phosphatase [candidate division KSB1 bacterium]|nr:serine/threonine-protein phosphatase [candidate division KSB1 bacterium]